VVREHLDAAPDGAHGVGGQVAEVDGIAGVADVDERGPGRATHERVFPAGEGIGPAPHVVAVAASDLRQRQEREEVDVAAGVDAGEAAHARRWSDRAERERRQSIGELAPVDELHAALFLGLPRILRAELLPVRSWRVVGGRGRREQEVRADQRQRHEKSSNGNARYPHRWHRLPFLACRSCKKDVRKRGLHLDQHGSAGIQRRRQEAHGDAVGELLESRHPRGPTLHLERRRRSNASLGRRWMDE
jgi:hypothetical protein